MEQIAIKNFFMKSPPTRNIIKKYRYFSIYNYCRKVTPPWQYSVV